MVLDPAGLDLGSERPWPKNALLVAHPDNGLITTPAYYVFRHLGAFVQPGATRIGVSGGFESLAFENPDGSVAVVLFNPDTEARSTTVGVKGAVVEFTVPALGWTSLHWE
jgi:glucosylceramidase